MKPLIVALTKMLTSIGDAVKSYYKSREIVYKERRFQRLKKATNAAEEAFDRIDELTALVKPLTADKETKKEINGLIRKIEVIRKRFNKYD